MPVYLALLLLCNSYGPKSLKRTLFSVALNKTTHTHTHLKKKNSKSPALKDFFSLALKFSGLSSTTLLHRLFSASLDSLQLSGLCLCLCVTPRPVAILVLQYVLCLPFSVSQIKPYVITPVAHITSCSELLNSSS